MKNIRTLSNLLAEELQLTMAKKGMVDEGFDMEAAISRLMEGLDKSIEDCTTDDGVLEEMDADNLYMVTQAFKLAGVDDEFDVEEGDFLEVLGLDFDEGTASVAVYDEDGEPKYDIITTDLATLENLDDSDFLLAVDDDVMDSDEDDDSLDLVEGAKFSFKGGKKRKISAAMAKLKDKLKAKKGNGVNKFTIKNGKIVKKSAEQIAADKKKRKTAARNFKKGRAKRMKSMAKSRKANAGCASGSKKKKMKVTEGFDVVAGTATNPMTIALEAGDTVIMEGTSLTVERDGKTVVSGISVNEEFESSCLDKGLMSVDMESVSEGYDPFGVGAKVAGAYEEDRKKLLAGVRKVNLKKLAADLKKELGSDKTLNPEGSKASQTWKELDKALGGVSTTKVWKAVNNILDAAYDAGVKDAEKKVAEKYPEYAALSVLMSAADNGGEITKGDIEALEAAAKALSNKSLNEGTEAVGSLEGPGSPMLVYRQGQGYKLLSEGSERSLGNRVRTRSVLVNEGFTVTSAQLDAAARGEEVVL